MIPANTTESNSRNPFLGFTDPFAESRAFPFLWLGHLISFLGSSVTMCRIWDRCLYLLNVLSLSDLFTKSTTHQIKV